ncbi:MAG TPA: MBL fold metallo-hydrolase [Methylibium sp.]|uniref:MBL fold metallo-hydrolase n=1 Tax=Methylibium sp. TaxID=2067992 RepID=UPI002DB723AF|nr:MBL fold metallo-hydrolase [Methylibium sp.]HEU4460546.1 MBL fold metallo-hydrolase [Methylibium sp.]
MDATRHPGLQGLTVFERGWLSSNDVLLHGADRDEGATLVDSSHCTHAEQTVALVRRALGDEPLARIVNTHLHSDHCGGNAALQAAFPGLPVDVPAGSFDAVNTWDEARLSYRSTGQRCPRFAARGRLEPDRPVAVGGRRWDVIEARGHDPDAVMLFDARHGVLISADALWRNGFGVVFPELEGAEAFDEAAAALDAIERLEPVLVIPGHGAPFDDVADALARARQRLALWRAEPLRHARHAARVLVKYHLMEERAMEREALLDWVAATPLLLTVWRRIGPAAAPSPRAWGEQLLGELVGSGALREQDGRVIDAA